MVHKCHPSRSARFSLSESPTRKTASRGFVSAKSQHPCFGVPEHVRKRPHFGAGLVTGLLDALLRDWRHYHVLSRVSDRARASCWKADLSLLHQSATGLPRAV